MEHPTVPGIRSSDLRPEGSVGYRWGEENE